MGSDPTDGLGSGFRGQISSGGNPAADRGRSSNGAGVRVRPAGNLRAVGESMGRFGPYEGAFSMAAIKGTIKRLVSDKGFGFVAAQDGTEYFFHQSACTGVRFNELREGQAVTFEAGQGPKGPRAERVQLD
jgi:cold shock protein